MGVRGVGEDGGLEGIEESGLEVWEEFSAEYGSGIGRAFTFKWEDWEAG